MVRLTFGRNLRITKRPLYQECYTRGRRYFTSNFIIFVRANNLSCWRLGIAVPRKIGPAVKRNRIKRLIRECFRLNQHHIHIKADIVVVCKKTQGLDSLKQDLVNGEIMGLISKLGSSKAQD